jgi:hypothetical protein
VRALVLLLLLANLLFVAWAHWIAPSRAPLTGHATPSATGANTIRLLREAPVPPDVVEPTAEPGLDLADAALACVSARPFLDRSQAEQAEARLARLGFAVRLRESRGQVHTGDWVRVEDLATPEDAANALAQLQAAGIADAQMITEEPPGTVISLGVFTEPARAEQAAALARAAGFEARTTERTREADAFWLDIDRQASAGLPSLEQLGAGDAAELPRIELQRCPAPAATPQTTPPVP